MPDLKLKMKEIVEPTIALELGDGSIRNLDPWAITEMIEAAARNDKFAEGVTMFSTIFDGVRKLAGFPTQAEVDAAAEPKPTTLSRHMCMEIKRMAEEFTAKFGEAKK